MRAVEQRRWSHADTGCADAPVGMWRGGWCSSWSIVLMALGLGLISACRSDSPASVDDGGLARTFEQGTLSHQLTPRVGYGGLKLRMVGERTYALEITRDAAYKESRRLVAYAAPDRVLWQLDEQPGELFTDFTVHPSGELSLGIERTGEERDTYDLMRLTPAGEVLVRQQLPQPVTLPAGDLGSNLPESPFLMKAEPAGSYLDKWLPWLRLEARGEELAVAFLSYVATTSGSEGLASGVMVLQWSGERYVEQWARIVDGLHPLMHVAWQYDEFHWRDAAAQPLLAIDPEGRVIVGRALSRGRCMAVSQTFQEISDVECRVISLRNSGHRYQPHAFTSFSPEGVREGTHVFAPETMEEFVVFDMAVRGDEVAIAGTAIRFQPDGTVAYYPASPGGESIMHPYDGYVAVLDRRTGALRYEVFVDEGRGEYFAALRWTEEGLLAAGATDWDRWNGGMSISRGAFPLLAWVSDDGGTAKTRSIRFDNKERHFHLLSVDVQGNAIMASGLSDAPMTHSGDTAGMEQMTFGGLLVNLQ